MKFNLFGIKKRCNRCGKKFNDETELMDHNRKLHNLKFVFLQKYDVGPPRCLQRLAFQVKILFILNQYHTQPIGGMSGDTLSSSTPSSVASALSSFIMLYTL
jgi:hypothetical protein